MNGHDESRLDSLAALAIGAVSAPEARELQAHLAECAICRQEFAELAVATDALALSAEARSEEFGSARSDRLKERIMKDVRGGAATTGGREAPVREPAPVVPLRARPSRASWWIPAVAAAAIVVAVVSTWNAATLRTRTDDLTGQVTALRAQLDMAETSGNQARAQLALEESRLADLVAPGATQFPISNGVVVRGDGRLLVALRRLPAPPAGKTYQVRT